MKFTIARPDDVTAVINTTSSKIREAGGEFEVDDVLIPKNGSFKIKGVHGKFHIRLSDIEITIDKKPFYVSAGYLQKGIVEYFS